MKHSGYNLTEVKAAARGNWYFLFEFLAPGVFTDAIKAGHRKHSFCPIHQAGGSKGSEKDFRFDKYGNEKGSAICSCRSWSGGFDLLMDLRGWNLAEVVYEVGQALGIKASKETPNNSPRKTIPEKPKWLIEREKIQAEQLEKELANQDFIRKKLLKVWESTLPIDSQAAKPAREYLASRGITSLPDMIGCRFHPKMPFWDEDGNKLGEFPALVGCITSPYGEFVTIHRHYLTPEGKKADVDKPKKMAPVHDEISTYGAAIRLAMPFKGVIGIAEGIETALSGWAGLGIPTWAAVSASIMKGFEPPADMDIHTIIIFADKDRSKAGQLAARELRQKLVEQGLEVLIMVPPLRMLQSVKSIDWNDVLMSQGIGGFPSVREVLQRLPVHTQHLMKIREKVDNAA